MSTRGNALLMAMAGLFLVPGAALADFGPNPIIDTEISCAMEGTRLAEDPISTPDDSLTIHGKVAVFNPPFEALNGDGNEYTYVIFGLVSQGTSTTITPNGNAYSTDYSGGAFIIYCDPTPDADPTFADKSTYTNGTGILRGVFTETFRIDTNTIGVPAGSGCAGNIPGTDFQFVGGTMFDQVSDGGVGFLGEVTSHFTICDAQTPAEWVDGCFGRARPKWDVEIPVPVQPATWGEVKQTYH
jgi:hypothetical protein